VTEMNTGWPIGLFICVRRDPFEPCGFATKIKRYQFEL